MQTKTKIIIGVVGVFAVIALLSMLSAWYKPATTVTQATFEKPPEMKPAKKIKTAAIPVRQIIALDKKEASEKLKLPEEIAKDDTKQITATAEIPPYEGKTDIIAIFNTATQATQINAKQQRLSFFALENKKAIGGRLGYVFGDRIGTEGEVYGRWDFLRVEHAHVGFYGDFNPQAATGRLMINLEYRW